MSGEKEWPNGWAASRVLPRSRLSKKLRVLSPIKRAGYTASEARKLAKWLLWAADWMEQMDREAIKQETTR